MSNNEKDNFGGLSNKQWNWKPKDLLEYSPLFIWPFDLFKFFSWFKVTYLSISIRIIVLFLSLATWYFSMPLLERCTEFKFDWILELFVRNLFLMFLVAGSLHLYLYTYKKQGLKLKFGESKTSLAISIEGQPVLKIYSSFSPIFINLLNAKSEATR